MFVFLKSKRLKGHLLVCNFCIPSESRVNCTFFPSSIFQYQMRSMYLLKDLSIKSCCFNSFSWWKKETAASLTFLDFFIQIDIVWRTLRITYWIITYWINRGEGTKSKLAKSPSASKNILQGYEELYNRTRNRMRVAIESGKGMKVQSCEMSQIWQINLCKFFGDLG